MATISGTGKWVRKEFEASNIENRDFYSGKIPSFTSTSYVDANEFEFGFSANGVIIRNPSAVEMQFQWLRRKGETVESGTVPAAGEIHIQSLANKYGILLRSDSGAAIAGAEVIAYG
jgi:hypothetical protein